MEKAAEWCLWTEKYCPKLISDVKGQDHILKQMTVWTTSLSVPHLLLYGRPGTGKTATAMTMLRARYGTDINTNVLLLNASDERNISIMRETVSQFAKSHALKYTDKAKSYQFKTVLLDEADSLTAESQVCLQGLMDNYVDKMRFVLICNYVDHIQAGLRSRCAVLQFHTIEFLQMIQVLNSICHRENIKADSEALEIICTAAKGDLRHALTSLQCMASELTDVNRISQLMGWPRSSHLTDILQKGLSISARASLLQEYQRTYGIPLQCLVKKLLQSVHSPPGKGSQIILRESAHSTADDPVMLMAIATILSQGT